MKKVRVIGVPRSGTNLVKYLIETNTDIRCYFNKGWWKHAIIPPLMTQLESIIDEIPTLIMFREPLRQIASFYKFARKGRGAISGSSDFRTFIASPIRMIAARDFKYYYGSPVEYWTQYYYAAIEWGSKQKFYVDLEELQVSPSIIGDIVAEIFPQARETINAALPDRYLGRNRDIHVSEAWSYETDTTLDQENQQAALLVQQLSPDDYDKVLNVKVRELYEQLRRDRSPRRGLKTVT
jgi:hypothetical protein